MAFSGPKLSFDDGFAQGWQASAIPVGSETTVFTYIVPPGGQGFSVSKASFSGRGDALMRIKIDGVIIDQAQIVWTSRNGDVIFPVGHFAAVGKVITITLFSFAEIAQDFYGSLHGRLV